MKVPFASFSQVFQAHEAQLSDALLRVACAGQYINGEEVSLFAQELSNYLSQHHHETVNVLPCANGTDALWLALKALQLPHGSKVLVPAFSFVSCAEAVVNAGLEPVFYPVDETSFTLSLENAETFPEMPEVKAIIIVHLFGLMAPMGQLMQWAKSRNLWVIEDVAQSLGASLESGELAGTLGDLGTTSFFPTKNLSCMGDGGAVFTKNSEFMSLMKLLASHGAKEKYSYSLVGINSRLDTLQAAVLRVRISFLEKELVRRKALFLFYENALGTLPELELPKTSEGTLAAPNSYTLKLPKERRNELKHYLGDAGIQSMVYYPSLLSSHPPYKDFNCLEGVKEQDIVCRRVLSISVFPYLLDEQADFCVKVLKKYWRV